MMRFDSCFSILKGLLEKLGASTDVDCNYDALEKILDSLDGGAGIAVELPATISEEGVVDIQATVTENGTINL